MFTELFARLRPNDRKQLVNRLDDPDANTFIGASWELAVLWALTTQLDATPGLTRPGVQSEPDAEINVGLDKPLAVDVKSMSGDAFDFSNQLDRVTRQLEEFYHDIVPTSPSWMSITFWEWRDTGAYIKRKPAVTTDPLDNPTFRQRFSDFCLSDSREVVINIPGVIAAKFERFTGPRQQPFNYHCSVPALIQTTENNQGTNIVDAALKQMAPWQPTHYTGLVLCDGGNPSFADPDRFRDWATPDSRGMMRLIVEKADLDFVVTVGRREVHDRRAIAFTAYATKPKLSVSFYPHARLSAEVATRIGADLARALSKVPIPSLQPNQAKQRIRSASRAGVLSRRAYLPPCRVGKLGRGNIVKISANALVDFLRGAMPAEEFERHTRPFRESLPLVDGVEGQKLKSIRLEELGDAEDDDYVEFEFVEDWNEKSFKDIARKLRNQKPSE